MTPAPICTVPFRRSPFPTALVRDIAGIKSRAEVLVRVAGGHFLIRDLERTRWVGIADVVALDSALPAFKDARKDPSHAG